MTATVEQIEEVLHGHPIVPSPLLGVVECATCGQDYLRDREKARQVAALGVGDGEVEYAVRVDDPRWPEPVVRHRPSRAEAERHLRDMRSEYGHRLTVTLIHRTTSTVVGPWVEVTDEGGEGA